MPKASAKRPDNISSNFSLPPSTNAKSAERAKLEERRPSCAEKGKNKKIRNKKIRNKKIRNKKIRNKKIRNKNID